MIHRECGGISTQLLGGALLVLLMVGTLGLAESARARLVWAGAARALAAALQSAAREDPAAPDAIERTFGRVLVRNLTRGAAYSAEVAIVEAGATDPFTGELRPRLSVTGRLTLPHRLEYMARWLPQLRLVVVHAEPLPKRKPPG